MDEYTLIDSEVNEQPEDNSRPWNMELKTFCMLMHLSQFGSMLVPGAGLVLPIVMWATNKDESPTVDEHGKNILNWMISSVIYLIVGFILAFIFVGFIVIIAVAICSLIFTILGAIKANNGEFYKYPMSIQFIK